MLREALDVSEDHDDVYQFGQSGEYQQQHQDRVQHPSTPATAMSPMAPVSTSIVWVIMRATSITPRSRPIHRIAQVRVIERF